MKRKMQDLPSYIQRTIADILPSLDDFTLHTSDENKFEDIDLYFTDDPRLKEPGYLGMGLNEFQDGSDTDNRLMLVCGILHYYFCLKD